METPTNDVPVFEAVQFPGWPRDWYTRVTWPSGKQLHSEPWRSQWAAEHLALLWRDKWVRDMKARGTGNGDVCPLFPDHGQMLVLAAKPGAAPRQYCPHHAHDGEGHGEDAIPRSRSMWPLHGFEESVATYMALLDRAIRQAELPDLSDLEVT
jgi:hypothetical protein